LQLFELQRARVVVGDFRERRLTRSVTSVISTARSSATPGRSSARRVRLGERAGLSKFSGRRRIFLQRRDRTMVVGDDQACFETKTPSNRSN